MKWFLVVAVLVLCPVATAATPPAGSTLVAPSANVAASACQLPPSSYRSNPAKSALWLASCLVAKKLGPRQMARSLHVSSSDPASVARRYATLYVQTPSFRTLAPRVGGKVTAKTILYNGCMAGFRARGRP
jgi:hypothetical protein